MSNETSNGKLFARIAAVMASVRSLAKDGHNKQSSYDYVSSANALENIGRAMADNGLVVIPMVVGYNTATEGKCTRTTIDFDMNICDADGNAFVARWVGEGIDYGNPDKAANKAMTNATKYFLMKLFLVGANDDDPDAETNAYEAQAGKPTVTNKPTQAPQRQAPAPQHRQTEATATPSNGNGIAKSAAFKRFMAEGTTLFGSEWDSVRHWIIESYTKKTTPDKVRTSANELTDAELSTLADSLKKNTEWFKTEWSKQPKQTPVAA